MVRTTNGASLGVSIMSDFLIGYLLHSTALLGVV